MPLQLTHISTRKKIPTSSPVRALKRPDGRAPSESSVRSEIFVATHATQFPRPVGAAFSAPDGA